MTHGEKNSPYKTGCVQVGQRVHIEKNWRPQSTTGSHLLPRLSQGLAVVCVHSLLPRLNAKQQKIYNKLRAAEEIYIPHPEHTIFTTAVVVKHEHGPPLRTHSQPAPAIQLRPRFAQPFPFAKGKVRLCSFTSSFARSRRASLSSNRVSASPAKRARAAVPRRVAANSRNASSISARRCRAFQACRPWCLWFCLRGGVCVCEKMLMHARGHLFGMAFLDSSYQMINTCWCPSQTSASITKPNKSQQNQQLVIHPPNKPRGNREAKPCPTPHPPHEHKNYHYLSHRLANTRDARPSSQGGDGTKPRFSRRHQCPT